MADAYIRLPDLHDSQAFAVRVVGDSMIDLKTARAAGVPFCGVAWGIRPQELIEAPGLGTVIHRAEELLAVVDGRSQSS